MRHGGERQAQYCAECKNVVSEELAVQWSSLATNPPVDECVALMRSDALGRQADQARSKILLNRLVFPLRGLMVTDISSLPSLPTSNVRLTLRVVDS